MNLYLIRKLIRRLPGKVIKAVHISNPQIIEGFGFRNKVGAICKEAGFKSVLIVTDKTLFSLGFHNAITKSLDNENIIYSVFSNISSEPTTSMIEEGRNLAQKINADCVVAIGGGSVLDCSKVISVSSKSKRNIKHFLRKFVFKTSLPLITIPSTSGTGAEITVGAVVKNKKDVKKSSVYCHLNFNKVILDSELTINAPSKITIACGIDALSHGLEGCIADVRVKREDMIKSQQCVKLAFENLSILIDNPSNIDSRQKMCLSANYGGNAINKQLAGYVHAIAHTIGAKYHLPHGVAIGYSLLPVVSYFKDYCQNSLFDLSVFCGFCLSEDDKKIGVEIFISKLKDLIVKCGYSGGLNQLNKDDYKRLVHDIDMDSINYSPKRTLKDKEIILLLDAIKQGAL